MKFQRFIFFSFLVLTSLCKAQDRTVDSLTKALSIEKNDTTKITILETLIENVFDDKLWPIYNDQLLKISSKLIDNTNAKISRKAKKGQAGAFNNIAGSYITKGNLSEALIHIEKSSKLYTEISYKQGNANCLTYLGIIYNAEGDIPKALDFYEQALKLNEALGNKDGIGLLLNNIGLVYKNQGDFEKALEYYNRSLKLNTETGNDQNVARSLISIGATYYSMKKYNEANDYLNRSLKLYEELKEDQGIANAYSLLGRIYLVQKKFTLALDVYFKGLKINKEIEDKANIITSYRNIANIYLELSNYGTSNVQKQKDLKLAYAFGDTSLVLSTETGFPELIRNAELILFKVDTMRKNYSEAFKHYTSYILYRDSINNENTRKASVKNQLKYEYEKKEAVIKEQQEKERAVAEEKSLFQQVIIGVVITGLLVVLFFAYFVFRSLKTTRHQKLIIEEKQMEILDSIHYAKRIQTALITPEKYIEKSLGRLNKG